MLSGGYKRVNRQSGPDSFTPCDLGCHRVVVPAIRKVTVPRFSHSFRKRDVAMGSALRLNELGSANALTRPFTSARRWLPERALS
jgi:hypothetical protein